jgi:hypothetical protein
MSAKHETITLRLEKYNTNVKIDKKIAPLISELWKANIMTSNSCENNVPDEFIWIQFEDLRDYKKFLNIIFLHERCDNEILQRAIRGNSENDCWRYDMSLDTDYETNEDGYMIDDDCECEYIEIGVSVRFPQKDLDFVHTKIKNFNEKIRQNVDLESNSYQESESNYDSDLNSNSN